MAVKKSPETDAVDSTTKKPATKKRKSIPLTPKEIKSEELKKMLIKAHDYAKINEQILGNGMITQNLSTIIHKYFGGIAPTADMRAAQTRQAAQSHSRVLVHTVDAYKKKPSRSTKVAPRADRSTSQLKLLAKQYGLNTAGKDHEEIMAMVEWHEKGQQQNRKSTLDHKARLRKQNIKVPTGIMRQEEE
jgi:hypothetical protein